jgi:hypothetical protein
MQRQCIGSSIPTTTGTAPFSYAVTTHLKLKKTMTGASDFDAESAVHGPAQPDLASLYAKSWDGSPADAARNLLLISRTVAAFGEAAQGVWPATIPLCAGHHDQNSLFRFVEPE